MAVQRMGEVQTGKTKIKAFVFKLVISIQSNMGVNILL